MKLELKSKYPLTNTSCHEATGKTLKEWFSYLDERGEPTQGRRNITVHLWRELKIDTWWATTIAVEYEHHHDLRKKDGRYTGYGICPTKQIKAPLQDVYDAWSTVAGLTKWYDHAVELTLEVGGSFNCSAGCGGELLRIRENKDLRFDWKSSDQSELSRVDVSMTAKSADKTEVLVNHSRIQTREEADGMMAAWGAALNRLKEVLEY